MKTGFMNPDMAKRLKKFREKYGYTIDSLAKEIDAKPEDVVAWEECRKAPSLDNLIYIAGLYDISLERLLKINGQLPPHINAENINMLVTSKASRLETFGRFPFAVIVLGFYLLISAYFNLWRISWVALLSIPIWYFIVGRMQKKSEYDWKQKIDTPPKPEKIPPIWRRK
ncbi:MAG: helix-turn-helix domain-containing protein [Oscillospiraceae bacterium]|jgi:transcriptional regulator with XRE-family HTH domain|nr:helix-turn-helix domain-containing protein [Oscillospiraceae bacterium]